ncbi:MAG: hypothetical protein ACE5HJ_03825 [Thermoplasmata archaeon]
MVHHVLAMLIAGGVISALHALGPDHWLPHVMVSKAQGWSMAKTLRVTLLSATGHVGLTVILGMLIIYLVMEFGAVSEALTSTVMAIVLGAVGLLFLAKGFRGEGHAHKKVMSDGAATLVLVLIASFPPCYAVLPLFLAASAYGWELALSLALLFSLLTVGVMLTLVTLGRRGYAALKQSGILHRLEEREDLIIGIVFIFLALFVWAGL